MNQLLVTVNDFLKHGGFNYAICGGFALDLFANKDLRTHSDIDICVFEKDKEVIFQFAKDDNWSVYEFQGHGIVRSITTINDIHKGRNLMCLKADCELVRFYPCDKGEGYFLHEFFHKGIKNFNYLEFLFNTATDNNFIFDRNINIYREMDKAILSNNGIPYLSPELVLLYKSRNADRDDYQFDFEKTVSVMDDEQLNWL